jgi:3-hydroxyacyl-[acyl-carrier-protein] dehydratase
MTSPLPRVVDPIVMAHRLGTDSAELELVVPHDLDFIRGHFPDAPVVPGVVQIKWAIALAQRYLAVEGNCTALENVKFQRVMTPRSRVTLRLDYAAAAHKLRFLFASVDVRYSSGRVVLGTGP